MATYDWHVLQGYVPHAVHCSNSKQCQLTLACCLTVSAKHWALRHQVIATTDGAVRAIKTCLGLPDPYMHPHITTMHRRAWHLPFNQGCCYCSVYKPVEHLVDVGLLLMMMMRLLLMR